MLTEDGTFRWEYEVYETTFKCRTVVASASVETTQTTPLSLLAPEGVTTTFRKPFTIWSDFSKGLLITFVILGVLWVAIEDKPNGNDETARVVLGVVEFSLLVGFIWTVWVRKSRHSWREWRLITFPCSRDISNSQQVGILSDEFAYTEQEYFVEALRAQIRLCHLTVPPPRDEVSGGASQGSVLARLSTSERDGTTYEYELYRSVVRMSVGSRRSRVETVRPLRDFNSEETSITARAGFEVFTELAQWLLIFPGLTVPVGVVLFVYGLYGREWDAVATGLGLVVLPLALYGCYIGVRYFQHDGRQWCSVELHCPTAGDRKASLVVSSDESTYAEQEQFLKALRSQIRRVRGW